MSRKINQSILVDRLRLIGLLKKRYDSVPDLPNDLIERAITERQS